MPQDSHELPSLFAAYRIPDPETFATNLLKAYERGSAAFAQLADRPDSKIGPYTPASEFSAATETLVSLVRRWLADPVKLSEAQAEFFRQSAALWNNVLARMLSKTVPPLITPAPGDQRFKDPEWDHNPFFDFCKQAYLLACKWAEDQLAATPDLDPVERHRAEFYLKQLTSAYSPTNFPVTNPEVLRETLATNAENLLKGATLLAEDLKRSGDLMKISQTDPTAFELGRNLATTAGKVVFQNDLLQLIQYSPTTENVRERPLIMVPPWINKYYILDLTAEKSFIRWCVDQGHTVFVVSWVNPDQRHAGKDWDSYRTEGIDFALDAIENATGERQVNAVGYCVGGTLLAATLAYHAKTGNDRIASVTFLAAQVDFTYAGDLKVFVDETQLSALEAHMAATGYLDGSKMAIAFNMLRASELIWPYVVNNYLKGQEPLPFDLLYWNSDSTRMAAANHGFYLRNCYLANNLAKGLLTLGGAPVSLKDITIPVYNLATRDDHIAPAKSVFTGQSLFGGPVEFVLSGSGHIAGVVNPPARQKYQYWTGEDLNKTFEDWFTDAEETPGSWWPHWQAWISEKDGARVPARTPGQKPGGRKMKPLGDAPGTYVLERT
jgi:polyhydroxyalkanoate synthase subunit PhaC